jgi:hypothetical protein
MANHRGHGIVVAQMEMPVIGLSQGNLHVVGSTLEWQVIEKKND